LLPAERAMSLSIPTSDGVTPMARTGCVQLPPPLEAVIDVWWLRQYAGGLFLPLRDGTAGESSYGGGRYALDTAKGADLGGRAGRLIIDLNFLYRPSCRYNDAWVCPLVPPGNTISAPVSAGERLPPNFGLPVVGVVEVKPAASVPLRALVAMGGDATRCQPPAFMRHVSCNVAVETGNTVQSATLGLALHHWWRGL